MVVANQSEYESFGNAHIADLIRTNKIRSSLTVAYIMGNG